MKYLKLTIELVTYILILLLSFVMLGLSVDPYDTPEQNLSLLLFAILILMYGVWRFMTRKEKIWIWQIF
jgi:hypothetical protein